MLGGSLMLHRLCVQISGNCRLSVAGIVLVTVLAGRPVGMVMAGTENPPPPSENRLRATEHWLCRMPAVMLPESGSSGLTEDGQRAFETVEAWIASGSSIPGVEESLIGLLTKGGASAPKINIVIALRYLGGDRSVSPLIEVLEKDDNVVVRIQAAIALGRIGQVRAVPALCRATQNSDVNVRANAYRALGQIGGKDGLAILQQGLRDKDPFVRRIAEDALRSWKKKTKP